MINYQEIIEKALSSIDWKREPIFLFEPIKYALEGGGKRLRPQLCLMATDMYDGDVDVAVNAALALEVFHNFTLLHDDLMDNAVIRRGRPSVPAVYGANSAILSGDQMLIEAYSCLAKLPKKDIPQMLAIFNQMATDICRGQQYDMDFEHAEKVTIEQYVEMITLKTAVLLATALKMGAMLASAPENDVNLLYNIGINLGIAFQIQDDVLDVYADPLTFGKAIGGDIVENKKTFIFLKAVEIAKPSQRKLIKNIIDQYEDERELKIQKMTDLYNKLSVKKLCEEEVLKYINMAFADITLLSCSDDKKVYLRELANKILVRNK